MTSLVDTHCHLQDNRLQRSLSSVVKGAHMAGVSTMICCGTCEDDWQRVISLSERHESVIPALGLHPWFTAARSEHWCATLRSLLEKYPRCVVGEIGLDHICTDRNDDEQMRVFVDQIMLASELKRPVSVHCRKAWGALLDALRGGLKLPAAGMVIHSYSGSPELVQELESYHISLSFSGSITYAQNKRMRRSAAVVSDDALLIETDSPDIAPYGYGAVNDPSTLPQIAATLAELRDTSVEYIAAVTSRNAGSIFIPD